MLNVITARSPFLEHFLLFLAVFARIFALDFVSRKRIGCGPLAYMCSGSTQSDWKIVINFGVLC